tara:strand:+ start:294 stop:539 length:246 start_codon:yes stop_codon:yes gene_type:complete
MAQIKVVAVVVLEQSAQLQRQMDRVVVLECLIPFLALLSHTEQVEIRQTVVQLERQIQEMVEAVQQVRVIVTVALVALALS